MILRTKISIIAALPVVLFLTSFCSREAQVSELGKGFIHPGKEYRALALWPWLDGFVDTARLVYELEQMKEKGMRGALIWDVGSLMDPGNMIPAGPAMLGKQSLQYFSLALNTGNKLDLDIGWFASSSWNAGGPWVEEANASMELLS